MPRTERTLKVVSIELVDNGCGDRCGMCMFSCGCMCSKPDDLTCDKGYWRLAERDVADGRMIIDVPEQVVVTEHFPADSKECYVLEEEVILRDGSTLHVICDKCPGHFDRSLCYIWKDTHLGGKD